MSFTETLAHPGCRRTARRSKLDVRTLDVKGILSYSRQFTTQYLSEVFSKEKRREGEGGSLLDVGFSISCEFV